ncbi:MAG TPA: DUF134 domain-containing protein [Candidatus Limiplasma sp.]|nr:DUF134 domain-containing protein [Candidatus Limiplasma sp.]HRX08887.1 DUF134 domain-containing protein [Candidatus Limiplasma sp.]
MPRPRKRRNICCLPDISEFMPVGMHGRQHDIVILAIDEYEAIRLIDYEGLSQEECSDNMNIARTTAQQIYANARKKIARALVEGLPIRIQGGDYRICNGESDFCGRNGCMRHRGKRHCTIEQEETT